jgi:phosphoserine phosphatase RsbU/P
MKHWICRRPVTNRHSGDIAEFIELGQSHHAIIVGDVAGHGCAAGVAARALSGYTRRLVAGAVPLPSALYFTSRYFSRTLRTDAMPFASMFIAVVDLRRGTLTYASAGHEPGLLFNDDGTHEHLLPTGPIIGVAANAMFTERKFPLSDAQMLVVVTDGITEARHNHGDNLAFFGTHGVATAVRDAARDGRDPASTIYGSAVKHAGGALGDDATVFVSSLTPVLRNARNVFA